jgi:hypothetical protein
MTRMTRMTRINTGLGLIRVIRVNPRLMLPASRAGEPDKATRTANQVDISCPIRVNRLPHPR